MREKSKATFVSILLPNNKSKEMFEAGSEQSNHFISTSSVTCRLAAAQQVCILYAADICAPNFRFNLDRKLELVNRYSSLLSPNQRQSISAQREEEEEEDA